jgi:hypothetical protein
MRVTLLAVTDQPDDFISDISAAIGYLFTFLYHVMKANRLCGLVVRVPGCRRRRPGFDFRRYKIF